MNFFSFFLPHFPGALRSERPLLPRRADALREGPVLFGRNRESRSREAAGRRNWPEAVPRELRGRKRALTGLSKNRHGVWIGVNNNVENWARLRPQGCGLAGATKLICSA